METTPLVDLLSLVDSGRIIFYYMAALNFRHLEFSIVPVGGAVTYFTRHRCNFVNFVDKRRKSLEFHSVNSLCQD